MPVANEQELQQMDQLIASMHVSEVGMVAVSLADTQDGPRLILFFNSCCGKAAYEMPVRAIADLQTGLQGTLDAMAGRANNESKH